MKIYIGRDQDRDLLCVLTDETSAKDFLMRLMLGTGTGLQAVELMVWDASSTHHLWTEAPVRDEMGWRWHRRVWCVWKSGHRIQRQVPVPLQETIEVWPELRQADVDLSFGISPRLPSDPVQPTKMTLALDGDFAQYVERD